MILIDTHLKEKQARWPNHKQWTVGTESDGRVFIQDDNFHYDARLYINGNFTGQKETVEYAAQGEYNTLLQNATETELQEALDMIETDRIRETALAKLSVRIRQALGF